MRRAFRYFRYLSRALDQFDAAQIHRPISLENRRSFRTIAELSPLLCPPTPQTRAGPVAPLLLTPLSASVPFPLGAASVPHQTIRWYASQQRAARVPKGAYSSPPGMAARGANLRISMIASNLVAEPFPGHPAPLPLSSWFTFAGWKRRWHRWMGSFKSIYTLSKVKKNIPGWSLPSFKQEALTMYTEACAALASGDRTSLRHLVAPVVFTDMKRQIKQREDGGWARIQWSMPSPPPINQIEVVHGRLIAADPKNDDTAFAQLTVRFRSGQLFAAYDSRGKLVAGGSGEETQVEDYWVFERPLKQHATNRWRVAARLPVPLLTGSERGS